MRHSIFIDLGAISPGVTACQPDPSQQSKASAPKAHRKCPDPDLRDINDPCSPMYLSPPAQRVKRDGL